MTDALAGSNTCVQLIDVYKSYGATDAVRGLSLTLNRGEVFAFLGPNGAGKTTTLKITAGLLRPDRGEVTVCGHSMLAAAETAKSYVAYIPDQPFVYEKLTGREFVMFLADMYGVDRRDTVQRLTAFADRVNMTPFLDRLCETYSHGMKQKIALAGALVHDPTLLIVDEPMVGLDPRTTRIIKDVFRELAAVGATIFMSTHTLDVAETIADRIAILNQGRIVGLGTLDELRQKASTDGRLEDVFLRLTAEAETEPLETRPAKALTQSEPRQ